MLYRMIISIRLGYILFVCSQLICTFFVSFCSEVSGDREVQRTMLELLNQLDVQINSYYCLDASPVDVPLFSL